MAHTTEKKVVFRRIRGRLVPIKVSAHSAGGFKAARTKRSNRKKAISSTLTGSGLIVGGIGLTVALDALTGFFTGKAIKRTGSKLVAARDFTRVAQVSSALGKQSGRSIKRAAKATFGAKGALASIARITKSGSFLKAGGLLLGTGIVASGVNKIGQSFSNKSTDPSGQIVSHLIGAGVTILGARALRGGLRRGLKGSGFKVNKNTQLEFKFDTGQ